MIVNICQMFTSVLFKCNSRSNIVPGVLDVLPYPHRHPIRRHCVSPILGMGKPNTGRLSNFLKATELVKSRARVQTQAVQQQSCAANPPDSWLEAWTCTAFGGSRERGWQELSKP